MSSSAQNNKNNQIQQFSSIRLQIYKEFWNALSSHKLNTQKLDDAAVAIGGEFESGRAVQDRNTGESIDSGAYIILDSLSTEHGNVRGTVKNFNTIEDFKRCDKVSLFNDVVEHIKNATSVDDITRILLITYSDIKKFTFHYLAATPAVIDGSAQWMGSLERCEEELAAEMQATQPAHGWCWIVKRSESDGQLLSAGVDDWKDFYRDTPSAHYTLAFVDPSSAQTPGWVLRNLLYYIATRFGVRRVNVFASRHSASLFGELSTDATYASTRSVGWEKNTENGKITPKTINLSTSLDPTRLANQAVDLNLKLMKWRILPELNLDSIASNKCLLLGAGTLGCYVARGLMAWGVRTITFVDNGKVSYSNPVRQPLFEFEDCLDGGKEKAECAAEKLRRVYPGVETRGVAMNIPMPGHPFPPHLAASVDGDIAQLEQLIQQHDTVFLLTDSRESRWLPSMLGKVYEKTVINAALGFDSYLVMRHGTPLNKLGCYYCNDIVAPTDSLSDRTLDQMCTVTRPGLAPLAAATAVEMLTSLVQHKHGKDAASTRATEQHDEHDESILGVIPHQIRGQLSRFDSVQITGMAYENCTACSQRVTNEYKTRGKEMIKMAINDGEYLVTLSGLAELYKASEDAIKDIQIDSGDESNDDF